MFPQRKQKDVAKENEFYLQLLQQALPLEQQAMSMQQIQPQVQSQTQHVTASLEQHIKTHTHKFSPQYNPSPEKSRGSLYLLSKYIFFFLFEINKLFFSLNKQTCYITIKHFKCDCIYSFRR